MGVQPPSTLARLSTGPLNPLCIGMKNTEGVRMNPCNLSESISWFSDELSFKIGRVRTA